MKFQMFKLVLGMAEEPEIKFATSAGSSKCLHTYTETKHHPRANKFQSKTYHANSPGTQEHTPELQNTGSSSYYKIIDIS